MFLFMFLVAGCLTSGSLAKICETGFERKCLEEFRKPLINKGPPQSAQDIFDECPNILSFFKCMKEGATACSDEASLEELVQKLEKVQGLLRDACDSETALHKSLTNNMMCIIEDVGPNRDVHNCAMEAHQQLGNTYKAKLIDESMLACGRNAIEYACLLLHADKKCGQEATEMLLSIAERLDYMFLENTCTDQQKERVLALVRSNEQSRNPIENVIDMLRRK